MFLILFFSVLFNLIEFFEKLVRVGDVSVTVIGHFIALNFFPTMASFMPIGSWLALCLILWELNRCGEWEFLQLLNISSVSLLKIFSFSFVVAVSIGVVVNEYAVLPLVTKMHIFKKEHLKKKACTQKVFAVWCQPQQGLFCYVDMLDSACGVGTGLVVIYCADGGSIEKVIEADSFSINEHNKRVTVISGVQRDMQERKQRVLSHCDIGLTDLLRELQFAPAFKGLVTLSYRVIAGYKSLSHRHLRELVRIIIERLLFYFNIFLYPLLALLLFMLFEPVSYGKWVVILVPYPFLTFTALLCDVIVSPWRSILIFAVFNVLLLAVTGMLFWYSKFFCIRSEA